MTQNLGGPLPDLKNYHNFTSLEGLRDVYEKSMLRQKAVNSGKPSSPDVQLMKEFINMVKGLLAYEPARRFSAEKALSHPFFATDQSLDIQFQ